MNGQEPTPMETATSPIEDSPIEDSPIEGGMGEVLPAPTTWKNKYVMFAAIAGVIIVSDQITKAMVMSNMPLHHSIQMIAGFFDLTHIRNTGGAFGIFADSNPIFRKILFLFMTSAAACLILYFHKQTPDTHRFLAVGWAAIFGGAVGNLIDRIIRGSVVDFLYFHIGDFYWPAFNVADIAITTGGAILLYHILLNKLPE